MQIRSLNRGAAVATAGNLTIDVAITAVVLAYTSLDAHRGDTAGATTESLYFVMADSTTLRGTRGVSTGSSASHEYQVIEEFPR